MSDKNTKKPKQDIKTFNVVINFDHDFDLVEKFLRIYLVSLEANYGADKFHVRSKLIQVLAFYILKGYSDETKQLILKSVKPDISYHNLNQINSELTRKQLIVKYSNNKEDSVVNWKNSYRELSPRLLTLRKYILEKDYANMTALLIIFKPSE